MTRAVLCALWLVLGQSPDPVLESVRERVLADTRQMKRFTCRQTVKRLEVGKKRLNARTCGEFIQEHAARRGQLPLIAWDRLRLDVAMINGHEVYSWAGAPKFEDELRKIVGYGAFGTGDFGPFLNAVFGTGAIVRFLGERMAAGRKLREYAYEVPWERSAYRARKPMGRAVTLAHEGTFLLDPVARDIVALLVRSQELPEELENCQAISEVKYGRTMIGSRNMLLPRETTFRVIKDDGGENINTTVYESCREYVGESVLRFDDDTSKADEGGAEARNQPIPGDLTFRARISTAIDSDVAAAGDEIEGVLTSDMVDRAGLIFAPNGSRVKGRMTQVSGSDYQVQIKLRLETVDLKGPVAFLAEQRARFPGRRVRLKSYQAEWKTEEH